MNIISYSKMTADEREAYAKERVRQQKEEERSGNKRRNNNIAVFVGSKIGTGVVVLDSTPDILNTTTTISL